MSSSDEQFQDWFMDQQHLAERCGISLNGTDQDRMEAAWEASRQAVEVQLPGRFQLTRQEVIWALEAAGIRVAP